jgi:hypothetical protein
MPSTGQRIDASASNAGCVACWASSRPRALALLRCCTREPVSLGAPDFLGDCVGPYRWLAKRCASLTYACLINSEPQHV